MSWIVKLLKQPSTWRGIIMIVTAAGVQLAPEKIDAIVSCGLAFAGVIGAFTLDSQA